MKTKIETKQAEIKINIDTFCLRETLEGNSEFFSNEIDEILQRVISSPQLLEALKALLYHIVKNEYKFEDNEAMWSLIEDAQDAITSATQTKGEL